MTSNGYAGHRGKICVSDADQKSADRGGGKGKEGFQWTSVPFKVSGSLLIDIQHAILLLLKLTRGLSC